MTSCSRSCSALPRLGAAALSSPRLSCSGGGTGNHPGTINLTRPILFRFAPHCWRVRVLALEPIRRASIIGPIAHQPAGFDNLARVIGRGNPIACCERRKLDAPGGNEGVTGDEEGVSKDLTDLPPAWRVERALLRKALAEWENFRRNSAKTLCGGQALR